MRLSRRQLTILGFQKGEKSPPPEALHYDGKTKKISCETDEFDLILGLSLFPVMTLDYLHYHGSVKGWGREKFRALLSNWAHLGVSEILIPHAKGRPSEREKWSGYYVWPRFGFEGKPHWKTISSMPCGKLKRGLEKTKSLRWLFEQPGGPRFWLLHGGPLRSMRFDLRPGSDSLAAWRQYYDGCD